MKHSIQRSYFNLVEIALAIAVLAFGIVVILGMLPTGLMAAKGAAAESYAGEIADQICGFYQQSAMLALVPEYTDLDAKFDAALDAKIMADYGSLVGFVVNPAQEDIEDVFDGFKIARTGTRGLFQVVPDGGFDHNDEGLFLVVMGNEMEIDGDVEAKIDFAAMIRVYKKVREYEKWDATMKHNATGEHNCMEEKCEMTTCAPASDLKSVALNDGQGAALTVEISYPLSKPYRDRKKRYYSFEVNQ